ncbi:MAG: DUF6603 domain-containing protein [Bacteroidia bacterium]|nr:DUF6603 domain-containing protein [Bacteroidia bacterium]
MNRITKLINRLDKWLEPLHQLSQDENFRGEMLLSLGMKEPNAPDKKEKTQKKLFFLLELLNKLRKKLGLDKSDIPNVSNIIALGVILGEVYLVYQAVREVLDSCDVIGEKEEDLPAEDREIAVVNALRALSRLLSITLLRKEAPKVAAWAEAVGIFSDEWTVTKRALDLTLFPVLKTAAAFKAFDTDFIRPEGDFKDDDHQRVMKGAFLDLTLLFLLWLQGKLEGIGEFLFNFGYELPPEKDAFPNAARVANRVLQVHFLPGGAFESNQVLSELSDSILSLVTIPVMGPEDEPLGYQYALKLELSATNIGSDAAEPGIPIGPFLLRIPQAVSAGLIWGHDTELAYFSGERFGVSTMLEMVLPSSKKPETRGQGAPPAEEPNSLREGEISLSLTPRLVTVDGQQKDDLDIRFEMRDFSLNISGDGRDGFLQKILPDGSAVVRASITLTYSPRRDAWTFEGLDERDGLFFAFKVNKAVFGKLNIPMIYLGLRPYFEQSGEQQALRGAVAEASAAMNLNLGPFLMSVDRLGLYLRLTFPENADGNLGAADLALGLQPPKGIGFFIKAQVVSGGGFLYLDPDNHQYYGAAELTVDLAKCDLSIKAVAVILTRMPDGSKGFSFLLLASLELDPGWDIGGGFKIKGLGLVVGWDRALDADQFILAVRDDRFDSILFPQNPVANAPVIVKAMNSLFPPTVDHFAFGLTARIGWGTTKLVDLKLGLLIEVQSNPRKFNKLALAGVLKVKVEEGKISILRLQINFLVLLDLGRKMFSLDAAIYDSKFLTFDLEGDMFVRYRWGDDPIWFVSVGGWHPEFTVPGGLNLPYNPKKVVVHLRTRDNPTLKLSLYLAVAPCAFMVGGAIEFKMKCSKFRLEADLSVDALAEQKQGNWQYLFLFEAKLGVYWRDSRLLGADIRGKITGPHPWHIVGSASFKVWNFEYNPDFDKYWGEAQEIVEQQIAVLPLLTQALRDSRNWQAVLPEGRSRHVHFRNAEADTPSDAEAADSGTALLADPLARLEVTQQVVPLGFRVDKVGDQRPSDFRKYDLRPAAQNGAARDLDDFFAPGMFLDLDDAEKLSRKSFEKMKSGQGFGNDLSLRSGRMRVVEPDYEDYFRDPLVAPQERQPEPKIPADRFNRWLGNNSIARSAEGRKAVAQMEIAARRVGAIAETFVVVDAQSGTKVDSVPPQKNSVGAYDELWKLEKANPLRKLLVVREFELKTPG